MRLRPLLVTGLVVAGIVAAFIVGEKQLRVRFGFAEGPNGVSVEQADDPDGVRIVVIRSRFIDETARYRADGTLLSRDLKAILADDADRVGTFRILIQGNQVIGTERYDFDKHTRTRTWTRYRTDGRLLTTRSEDEDTGVEWWWDASGKVITAKEARQIVAADDSALPLDAAGPAAAATPPANGLVVAKYSTEVGYRGGIYSRELAENNIVSNGVLTRSLVAFLRNDAKRRVTFSILIRKGQVVETSLTDGDVKRQRAVTRLYGPDGVLLYVHKTESSPASFKEAYFSPDGRSLTRIEVDDIEATNADENAIPIPVPQPVK